MLNNWKIKSRYLAPFLTPNKVFMGHSSPQHTHKKTWIAWRPENTASRSLDTSCSFTGATSREADQIFKMCTKKINAWLNAQPLSTKAAGTSALREISAPRANLSKSHAALWQSRSLQKPGPLSHCCPTFVGSTLPIFGSPSASSKTPKGRAGGVGPTYKPQHTSSPQTPTTSTYIGLREGQGGRALTPPRPSGRPDNSKGSTDVKDSKVRGQHLSLGLSRSPSRRVQLS